MGSQNTYPVRWILDAISENHCEACFTYSGEYETWGKMMARTEGAQPGYFPTCVEPGKYAVSGKGLIACGKHCKCEVEVKIGGEWIRLESPFRGERGHKVIKRARLK